VAASLKEFGFRQPIVVDAEGVIVCGHTRYKAALKLGLEKVPVHVARDLSPEQIRAYRIADNQTASLATWNYDLLPIELAGLKEANYDLGLLGFDESEIKRMLDPVELLRERTEKYTQKVAPLIYEPKSAQPPKLNDLVSGVKEVEELIETIKLSLDLSDDEKRVFMLAAYRFIRFRFDKIAEYYSHSSPAVRRIMEQLCLVIVDADQAIERGWCRLITEFQEIMERGIDDAAEEN
jgi:hypothetical protein